MTHQSVDDEDSKSKSILGNSTATSRRFRLALQEAGGHQLLSAFTDDHSASHTEDTVGAASTQSPAAALIAGQFAAPVSLDSPGLLLFEAAVPMDNNSGSFSMPFNNTLGYGTSIAIQNPFATTGTHEHQDFETTTFREVIDTQGALTITPEIAQSIVVRGRLFNPQSQLTTSPA